VLMFRRRQSRGVKEDVAAYGFAACFHEPTFDGYARAVHFALMRIPDLANRPRR